MFIIDKLTQVNLFKLSVEPIQVNYRLPIPGISNDKWLLISTFPTQHVLRTTAAIPLWIIYAVVQGTLATGPWVIGSLDFKALHLMEETHGILTGIGKCPILGLLDITFEWQL